LKGRDVDTGRVAAWEEAVDNLDGEIDDIPSLPFPTRSIISLAASSASEPDASGKRKAPAAPPSGKKSKLADGSAAPKEGSTTTPADGFESIFSAEMLLPPKLLSEEEIEKAIVARQKAMLLEEYGVDNE
jgi:pre-mRNA-splicing factor ISY1